MGSKWRWASPGKARSCRQILVLSRLFSQAIVPKLNYHKATNTGANVSKSLTEWLGTAIFSAVKPVIAIKMMPNLKVFPGGFHIS
jgi:hypothetical protein